jgi:hypothetical protein
MADIFIAEHDVAEAMVRYGGGFASALGKALFHADAENHDRIKAAFPELWEQYRDIARRTKAPVE